MSMLLIPSFDDDAVRAIAARCGAQVVDDPHGPQTVFSPVTGDAAGAGGAAGPSAAQNDNAPGGVALLTDWGIVSARGADAITFLQGQTTNDVAAQGSDELRLNGYCTPKGRLLAGGPLWRDGDALRLAVSRPLAAPLRKRLAMYVLRAKVTITDDSDTLAIIGLAGDAASQALRDLGIDAPAPMQVARGAPPHGEQTASLALGLPAVAGFGPRWWLVVPIDSLAQTWAQLAARLAPRPSTWWRAGEILSGLPRIVAATSEAFVPQTVNWELIGAVNFRKGCYPGQEVVARLHYRGKPKRRTFIGRLAPTDGSAVPPIAASAGTAWAGTLAALAPGADLLDHEGQPAGIVIASAPAPDGGVLLLHEAQIETATQGGLRVADGRPVVPLPMPYPVPAEPEAPRAQPKEPA